MKNGENLVIKSETTLEVKVCLLDLMNDKSYLFYLNKHKNLRETFITVMRKSMQLKKVVLYNLGQLPRIIQKNKKD